MRFSNDNAKSIIFGVYYVMLITTIFTAVFFRTFDDITKNLFILFLLIVLTFIAIFFAMHNFAKYFEYDSDGTNIIITNKGLLLSNYFKYKENIVEFKKDRLDGYKIYNFIIYRVLVVFIKDKKHEYIKKERFNITLVSKKKRKYIRQSLRKTVKLNRKENS